MALSLETVTGPAAPLLRANIDAMTIAPRTPAEMGGAATQGGAETVRPTDLFAFLRFRDGSENPDFVLNQPQFRAAKFLIAGANFGCGSAREHAVWALRAFGLQGVVAPSFGPLFYGNCFKNALVPIELDAAEVARLAQECAGGAVLTLDLGKRALRSPAGRTIGFDIPAFRSRQLIEGLDEIDMTLKFKSAIADFHRRASSVKPWLYGVSQ